LIRRLASLAGEQGKDGEWIKEPITLDLAAAHELRSLFRHNVDWTDLPSDIKNGALKRFAGIVDSVIQQGDGSLVSQQAAAQLNQIDRWYAKVMPIWKDRRVQAVVDGMENGQPADPQTLVKMMIKEGNTDFNNKIRRMLGPNLWAGIRGAHANELISRNRNYARQVDGAAFARDVLSDYNSGLLTSIHGEEGANKIFRQAQYAAALEGKLDLNVRPGDTVLDVIGKARIADAALEAEAKKNPLALLKKEMTRLKQQENLLKKEAKATLAKNPLRFLHDRSVGADKAIDKILASEDLIVALEGWLGRDSEEFKLVQQVAAQRVLSGTLDPAARLKTISPEVQELVFGTKLEDAKKLASEMEFLTGTSSEPGTSMLATTKVTSPYGSGVVGKTAKAALSPVGGAIPGRALLAKFYDLQVKLMQSPSIQRWIRKGLEGDPAARQVVKEQVQRMLQIGGAMGAGLGEAVLQSTEATPAPLPEQ
jgi:hypothetical protein